MVEDARSQQDYAADGPPSRPAADGQRRWAERSLSPEASPELPLGVARLLAAGVAAVAMGVIAERACADQRDSMTWGLYGTFVLLAALIGTTQRKLAWVVGLLFLPSYWWSSLSRWPSTSTAGVGWCFSIVFAIPHAVAAHLGMLLASSWRGRRRSPDVGAGEGSG